MTGKPNAVQEDAKPELQPAEDPPVVDGYDSPASPSEHAANAEVVERGSDPIPHNQQAARLSQPGALNAASSFAPQVPSAADNLIDKPDETASEQAPPAPNPEISDNSRDHPPATPDAPPAASPAEQEVSSVDTRKSFSGQVESDQPARLPGLPPAYPSDANSEDVEAQDMASFPSYEELLGEYPEMPQVREGELCQGQVVSISSDSVVVDIGGKTEGLVPTSDFRDKDGEIVAQPGDEIEVLVERLGAPGDYAVLSYRRARQSRIWERIEQAYGQQSSLPARVVKRVKGGLTVDIGVPAFLPGSQVDIRPTHDLDSLVGQQFPVRIVRLSRSRQNIVVSRRKLLDEELEALKQQTLARLSEGSVVTGAVKSVTGYGVFVDLGGIDGLVHVTDISYSRVKNPAEILKPGDEVTAKVMKFDAAKERVSLSMKHMHPDPWAGLEERYREADRVTGRIVSLTDYGAFVELAPGVEGLIHITEMSWSRRPKHPSKAFKPGQQVEAVVVSIDPAERRIALSLKRLEGDPWETAEQRYQLGSVVEGRVRNLTSYGAFVELEAGVDGLVHVTDITRARTVKHPKEVFQKGQSIKAVVLHVDRESRRISLGTKQLEPDAWEVFLSTHLVGDVVTGSVTRHSRFGCFVELAPGIEGLCHNSEMSPNSHQRKKTALRVGQQYEFKIIKLDEYDKKIGLSRRSIEAGRAEPHPDSDQRSAASSEDAGEVSAARAEPTGTV